MKYIICKECGFTYENREQGFYFCPQCHQNVKFYQLELFDGAKPGKIYDRE